VKDNRHETHHDQATEYGGRHAAMNESGLFGLQCILELHAGTLAAAVM
jgi:hypothetical protein